MMNNLADWEKNKIIESLARIADEMTLMRKLVENVDLIEIARLARLYLEATVMKEISK